MPATGTPEPGGLSWDEIAGAAARDVIERRSVVACDVVELSPIPGMVAPNFLCAKLIYKLLTYRFAADPRSATWPADLELRADRRPLWADSSRRRLYTRYTTAPWRPQLTWPSH